MEQDTQTGVPSDFRDQYINLETKLLKDILQAQLNDMTNHYSNYENSSKRVKIIREILKERGEL
jgi:hypothetical protein